MRWSRKSRREEENKKIRKKCECKQVRRIKGTNRDRTEDGPKKKKKE